MTGPLTPVSAAQADAVDRLAAAVAEPGAVAVLRGGRGIGRTTTLDLVAARLGARLVPVVVVRARAGGAAVTRDLLDAGVEPGSVIVVDDADLLGEVDAAVISSAVATGTAAVVLAVGDEPVPLAVTGLLRHGHAEVVGLRPLDATEAATFARRLLGAPVAPDVGRELVARTGGLPGSVAVTATTWRDAGLLTTTHGVWTVAGDLDAAPSVRAADPVDPHPAEVLVAVAGLLPLAALERTVDDDTLVALERDRVLEVVGDLGHEQVRLRDPDRADAVAGGLDPHERREVVTELVELVDPTETGDGPTDRATVQLARWRLELHGSVNPEVAVRAGEAALRTGDLVTADRLAALASGATSSTRAALLRAAVLQRQGRLDEAHDVLRSAWAGGPAPVEQLDLAVRLVDAHLHLTEDPDATRALAADLAAALADPGNRHRLGGAVAYAAIMAGQVGLARDLLADRAGAEDPASNGPVDGGAERPDPVTAFVDLAVRVLTGEPLDGWTGPDDDDPTPMGGSGLLATDACRCFRLFHDLHRERPAEVATAAHREADAAGAAGRHLAEGWASWLEAVGAVYGGGLAAARHAADRAWRTFATQGLDSRLRAVLAVLDLVAALDPDGEAVVAETGVPLVTAPVDVPAGTLWFFRGEQLRFAALRAGATDRAAGATALAAAAPELARGGLRPAALLAECESLLLGATPTAPDRPGALVAEATALDAGAAPAPFVAVAAAARAVAADDTDAALEAVDRLLHGGRLLHAHLALGTVLARPIADRGRRSALLHRVATVRATSDLDPLAGTVTPVLTPAERAVADLVVQGLGNREVADRLGLAKRTVDNTLASAYRRLGIDDRRALATILGPA